MNIRVWFAYFRTGSRAYNIPGSRPANLKGPAILTYRVVQTLWRPAGLSSSKSDLSGVWISESTTNPSVRRGLILMNDFEVNFAHIK